MKIRINSPCPEQWENMQDFLQDKFCEKCSKCVVDFTGKTNQEIQNIITNADGKDVCGRIPSKPLSMIAAGIILVTNLNFSQAQVNNNFPTAAEQTVTDSTKISGRLIFKESQKVISNAEVFFISKSKFIKTTTNENGYFSLIVPNDFIKSENVLYFNFDKLNETRRNDNKVQDSISGYDYGDQSIIFSRNEKIENKKFEINYGGFEIGAVVIVSDPPPDYYFFNGVNISQEKFEKLRKENFQYQYFSFKGKEAEIIANDSFIDTLYLLYSQ